MMKNLYTDENFLNSLREKGGSDEHIEYWKNRKDYFYSNSKWSVSANDISFKLNNKGIKLWAKREEHLTEVSFDIENKTVSLQVETPVLSEKAPRKVDLSDDPQFFEDLRENIEEILLKGEYSSVTPNEDRTIFKIS